MQVYEPTPSSCTSPPLHMYTHAHADTHTPRVFTLCLQALARMAGSRAVRKGTRAAAGAAPIYI